jgi:hypothetical protein
LWPGVYLRQRQARRIGSGEAAGGICGGRLPRNREGNAEVEPRIR